MTGDQWIPFDGERDWYAEILTCAFGGGFQVLVDAERDGTADDPCAADPKGDRILALQVLRYVERLFREVSHVAELLDVTPPAGSTEDPAEDPPQVDPTAVQPAADDPRGDSPSPSGQYVVDGRLVGDLAE